MEDECILSKTHGYLNKCVKYNCICDGTVNEKYKCTMWAEAISLETYYYNKVNIDKVLAGV